MYTLFVQVVTLTAAMLAHMAHTWQVDGYGLVPYIAYPAATLLIVLPLMYEVGEWVLSEPVDDPDPRAIETAREETVYLSPTMSWPSK